MAAAALEAQGQLVAAAIQGVDAAQAEVLCEAVKGAADAQRNVFMFGVGKSELVGTLFAAMLRSYGVHGTCLSVTDTLHGDMAIVSPEDLVVCITKSGKTSEVELMMRIFVTRGNTVFLVTSSERFNMKGVTKLVIPMQAELCDFGLSPVTSPPAYIAVLHAVALRVRQMMEIRKEEYVKNHPGGSIGVKTLTVGCVVPKETMQDAVCPDTALHVVRQKILQSANPIVAVVDSKGRLQGIVCRKEIASAESLPATTPVDKMMNSSFFTVHADHMALDAVNAMLRREKVVAFAPVVDADNAFRGVFAVLQFIGRKL